MNYIYIPNSTCHKKMATFQQLVRKSRKLSKGDRANYTRSPKMEGNPQRKAIVKIATTTKPKKPNSAVRKIVKARIAKKGAGWIRAVIPGIGHSIKEFDTILFRAARSRDIPGMHYKVIRGALSFKLPEQVTRNKGRSKYGVRRPKKGVKRKVISLILRVRLMEMGYRVRDDSRRYVGDYHVFQHAYLDFMRKRAKDFAERAQRGEIKLPHIKKVSRKKS